MKKLTLRLPDDLGNWMEEEARREHRSKQGWLMVLIEAEQARRGSTDKGEGKKDD